MAIELFENDADVIEGAADQRMAHVRMFQTGQNSAVSQRILNELSAAKLCLLNPQKKADYNRQLRQAEPPPVLEPVSFVVAQSTSSTSAVRTRVSRKQLGRQAVYIAAGGAAVVVVLLAIYSLNAPGKPGAAVRKRQNARPTESTSKKSSQLKSARGAGKRHGDQKAIDAATIAARQRGSAPAAPATPGLLKIFEDEPEFVTALVLGDGSAELDHAEAYSGNASVRITVTQKYYEALPGLNAEIRTNPTGTNEYRYLRFAWKKRGGEQIWLKLHYPGNWLQYHAGPLEDSARSGVRVADELPVEFVAVTRDLAADFGEFTLTGLALTPEDGECAWFDHVYLARTLEDFEQVDVPLTRYSSTRAVSK